jgi:hypothetical protein
MKLALFCNKKFTEVYIDLEKVCYSLTEFYVKSVYLNLFGWRGVTKFMKYFKVGGGHKR